MHPLHCYTAERPVWIGSANGQEARVTIDDQKEMDGRTHLHEQQKGGTPYHQHCSDWLTDLSTEWLCYVLCCVCLYSSRCLEKQPLAKGFPGLNKSSIQYRKMLASSYTHNTSYFRKNDSTHINAMLVHYWKGVTAKPSEIKDFMQQWISPPQG